jgi:hypothetical protein
LPRQIYESFDAPRWAVNSEAYTQGDAGTHESSPGLPAAGNGAHRVTVSSGQNVSKVVLGENQVSDVGEYWFAVSLRDDGFVSDSYANASIVCRSAGDPTEYKVFAAMEMKPASINFWGHYLTERTGINVMPLDVPHSTDVVNWWLHFRMPPNDDTAFVELWADCEKKAEVTGAYASVDCTGISLHTGIERNPSDSPDTLMVDELMLLRTDTLEMVPSVDDIVHTLTPGACD